MKIVTHPLYQKCIKVIDSCETLGQLDVAKNYMYRCMKYLPKSSMNKNLKFWRLFYRSECIDMLNEKYESKRISFIFNLLKEK